MNRWQVERLVQKVGMWDVEGVVMNLEGTVYLKMDGLRGSRLALLVF